jgi:hypothetical protein
MLAYLLLHSLGDQRRAGDASMADLIENRLRAIELIRTEGRFGEACDAAYYHRRVTDFAGPARAGAPNDGPATANGNGPEQSTAATSSPPGPPAPLQSRRNSALVTASERHSRPEKPDTVRRGPAAKVALRTAAADGAGISGAASGTRSWVVPTR